MRSHKIAIIVGIDGAGKSTVIGRLGDYHTSHWRLLEKVSDNWASRVATASGAMKTLKGKARTAFILTLIDGEWNEYIEPHLSAGRDVVCDGFYLRPLIKEMVFGDGDVGAVERASPLSGDELIIFIDVPVQIAAERKVEEGISAYERFDSPGSFAEFQTAQRDKLLTVIEKWTHVVVDGTQSAEHVEADVRAALERYGIRPRELTRTLSAPDRVDAGA